MTFPTINYKFHSNEEAKSLTDVVDQKIGALQKFIAEESDVVCEVEFEKISNQQQGRVHRVEVNLSVNGKLYRAEATENTFDGAIDKVRDELDAELSRAKDKQITLDKDAGREMKAQLLN